MAACGRAGRLSVTTWGKTAVVPETSPAADTSQTTQDDTPVGLAAAAPLPAPAEPESGGGSESVGTVIIAGLANLVIAVAKLVAGLLSGSAAMLSESAHSLADTVTEVFLFVALRRGGKPA